MTYEYNMIDRFLRNNLDDDDYAEFSTALDSLADAPQAKDEQRLTDAEIYSVVISAEAMTPYEFARAIESKIRGDV